MFAILHSLGMFVADLFKPRCRLEAENLFLRHQLSIALRRAPPRLRLATLLAPARNACIELRPAGQMNSSIKNNSLSWLVVLVQWVLSGLRRGRRRWYDAINGEQDNARTSV